jgi:hypothetical protein
LRILFCALLIAALSCVVPVFAQRKDFNIYDGGVIPRSLQPSLIQRTNAYVEAQRDGSLDKVAELLGPLSNGYDRREHTSAEKEWVIQKLKEKPLLSFTPKDVSFSTANYNRPFAKRSWYLEGEGKFLNSEKEKVVITLYRHNSEWYFQPMVVNEIGIVPLLRPTPRKPTRVKS